MGREIPATVSYWFSSNTVEVIWLELGMVSDMIMSITLHTWITEGTQFVVLIGRWASEREWGFDWLYWLVDGRGEKKISVLSVPAPVPLPSPSSAGLSGEGGVKKPFSPGIQLRKSISLSTPFLGAEHGTPTPSHLAVAVCDFPLQSSLQGNLSGASLLTVLLHPFSQGLCN